MDLHDSLAPVPDTARFSDENYFIWGASMVQDEEGKCHLFYSRWPRELGHNAWLTHSEIAHAVADSPLGLYVHIDIALPARGESFWDGHCTHNPTVHKFGETYYLYYMGNRGDGQVTEGFNWSHRNNQRIGVAVAKSPNGPWTRQETPLIDIGEKETAPDALMTSNPTICQGPDGEFLLIYKAVGKKRDLPAGGPVVHLSATSKSPTGPFAKRPDILFTAPGDDFPAEDPFIWSQDNKYYAIVKDMKGGFTGEGRSLALFESQDGATWNQSPNPLVSKLQIQWESSGLQKLMHLERPQLWLENGIPAILFCAADTGREHSFNVHIPIR